MRKVQFHASTRLLGALAIWAALALSSSWIWHIHESWASQRNTNYQSVHGAKLEIESHLKLLQRTLDGEVPEEAREWTDVFSHLESNLQSFFERFNRSNKYGCTISRGGIERADQPIVSILDFMPEIGSSTYLATRDDSIGVSFLHVSYAHGRFSELNPNDRDLRRDVERIRREGSSEEQSRIPGFSEQECQAFSALADWLKMQASMFSSGQNGPERYERGIQDLTKKVLGDPANDWNLPSDVVTVRGVVLANSREARANFPAYGTNSSRWWHYDPRQRPWWQALESADRTPFLDRRCRLTKPYPDIGTRGESVRTLSCLVADGDVYKRSAGSQRWILAIDLSYPDAPLPIAAVGELSIEHIKNSVEMNSPLDLLSVVRIDIEKAKVLRLAFALWFFGAVAFLVASATIGGIKPSVVGVRLFAQFADRPEFTVKEATEAVRKSVSGLDFKLGGVLKGQLSATSSTIAKQATEGKEKLELDVLRRPELRGRERWLVQNCNMLGALGWKLRLSKGRSVVAKVSHRSGPKPEVIVPEAQDDLPVKSVQAFILSKLADEYGWGGGFASTRVTLSDVGELTSGGVFGRVMYFDRLGGALSNLYKERNVDAVVQWATLEILLRHEDSSFPGLFFEGARLDRTILFPSEEELERASHEYRNTFESLYDSYRSEGGVLYVASLENSPLPIQAFTEMTFTLLDRQVVLVTQSLLEGRPFTRQRGELWTEGYITSKPADVRFFSALYDKLERREWTPEGTRPEPAVNTEVRASPRTS